jgi:hypothetical protein
MRVRRETVEHPFGTLKMRMGTTHFLMKTLPRVATEMALHVLAYDLMRVMNPRHSAAHGSDEAVVTADQPHPPGTRIAPMAERQRFRQDVSAQPRPRADPLDDAKPNCSSSDEIFSKT